MGMDKSGTQAISSNVWTKLVTFTVRTGYPLTNISGDSLVLDGGTGDVRFRGDFTSVGNTQQFRVTKNGSTVVGSVANTGVTTTVSAQTFVNGDTLSLEAFTDTGFSARRTVASGGFLEFNQTTTNYDVDASRGVVWGRSAEIGVGGGISATDRQTVWGRSAELSANASLPVSPRTINWAIAADLYKGQNFDIAATRPISWGVSADLLHIQPAQNLNPDFDSISVSVHTADGRGVGDFGCRMIGGVTWGRERAEVSACQLTLATEGDPDLIEDLRPWVHWVTVWHGDRPMWSGPIQQVKIGRAVTTVSARDPSTFMWRTRAPVTKTWVDTDPTGVAEELLAAMLDLHRVAGVPLVLPNVTEAFTYHTDADSRMVNQLVDDLVKLGLQWTVVAGKFILGEFNRQPFAELAECDFLVEIERLRDGTATFNDVRVQGQNFAQTAIVPLANLHLQSLVSLDDVYGVSNIQKATQRYAQETAAIRDVLQVPGSASLHPDAPVTLTDLVPGRVLKVNAAGVSQLMHLDQVQFSITPDSYDTQVTLVAVQDKSELAELVGVSP